MFGIKLEFKDGSFDWIDPVEEWPVIKDGVLSVSNICYSYDYNNDEIKEVSRYELCEVCNHDVDTYDCHEKCEKP